MKYKIIKAFWWIEGVYAEIIFKFGWDDLVETCGRKMTGRKYSKLLKSEK